MSEFLFALKVMAIWLLSLALIFICWHAYAIPAIRQAGRAWRGDRT